MPQRRPANLLNAGVGRGEPGEQTLRFPTHLHAPRNAPLQGLVLPMPILKLLQQELPGRLILAGTPLKQQMLLVAGSIHRCKHHRLHTLAVLLAEASNAPPAEAAGSLR